MKKLNLVQGSEEWLKVRLSHFTASEAPAMMGDHKQISRTDLLDHKKGWITTVDEFTQKIFDEGHRAETLALPYVEQIIGDELYPTVGVLENTIYLASFDGLTMFGDIVYEHKLWNKTLAENVVNKVLEPHYYWQLEHQLYVSGAEKAIFVVSDGTDDNMAHMYYESIPERRDALLSGWIQFEVDLENHTPKAKTEKVKAAEITSLPRIQYDMNGMSLSSNIAVYKNAAEELVKLSEKSLETDQDFADAEARQKVFIKAESDIKDMCDQVLGEVSSINDFVTGLKSIASDIRTARLAESKQIKTRKEEIKNRIVSAAEMALAEHAAERLSELKIDIPPVQVDFAAAVKGKRNIDSLNDAIDTALAAAKIQYDEHLSVAQKNLDTLKTKAIGYHNLFSDWKLIAYKDPGDFEILVKARIAEYKLEEDKRQEAEKAAQAETAKQNDSNLMKMPSNRSKSSQATTEPQNSNEPNNDYERGYIQALKDVAYPNGDGELVVGAGRSLDDEIKKFLARVA